MCVCVCVCVRARVCVHLVVYDLAVLICKFAFFYNIHYLDLHMCILSVLLNALCHGLTLFKLHYYYPHHHHHHHYYYYYHYLKSPNVTQHEVTSGTEIYSLRP